MATEAEHETLLPPVHVDLEWVGEQKFTGGRPDAPSTTIDGKRTVAPSPVDTLVLSLIACSAIDVLHVLEKRRTPARSLNASADFARVDGFPKRLKTVRLTFKVDTDTANARYPLTIDPTAQQAFLAQVERLRLCTLRACVHKTSLWSRGPCVSP